METTVTRNGQITLSKKIRDKLGIMEGTRLVINSMGETILISKKDPKFWENFKGHNLSKEFDYKKTRKDDRERLVRLNIV